MSRFIRGIGVDSFFALSASGPALPGPLRFGVSAGIRRHRLCAKSGSMTDANYSWLEASGLRHAFADAPPRRWLVTGGAGFIGSHLVETLLRLGQSVRVLDNFATGYERNLEAACAGQGANANGQFELIRGDIRDPAVCETACHDIDIVLHQAALGSVPRSIADPLTTNAVNVGGFLNMLNAARTAGVRRFVYAASSSTYGDDPNLPNQ